MSELYALPDGWEWKKISEVFKIKSGKFLPKKRMDKNGKYDVYGGNGINGTYNEYNLSGNNIIIGRVGALCGNVRYINDSIWLTDNAFYISNYKIDLSKLYLAKYLGFIELGKTANQSAQPVISYKSISVLNIPLPSLQEQKRIVAKLDELLAKIDQAITLHHQNIDEADKFMGSVLNKVFVELEEKYNLKEISSLFKIRSGNFLPKKNMIESGNTNVYGGNGINGVHNEFNLSGENVLIGRVGALCGNVRFVKGNIWVTDNAFYISEYLKEIDKSYLRQMLVHIDLGSSANQAAQPVISYKGISKMRLPLPPLKIQQKTVTYLDQLSQKTEALKQVQKEKLENLRALKASILDSAFRGEL